MNTIKVAYGHTRITHITGVGGSSHRGLQHVAAFGLIQRSKSETQGLLSRRGGAIRARLGLLHLTHGTVLVWNKLQSVHCSVPDYISVFRSFHNIHKTQLLIPNNHPYPKQNQKYWRWQNIGGDKILAVTKYWGWQNIGGDKTLSATKYTRRQHYWPSTKYWRQQNVDAYKILASTKYVCQWNPGIDKILVSTKRWRR